MKTCAIILNSPTLDQVIDEKIIICADGGYRHAVSRDIYAIVGDMDSATVPDGIRAIKFPPKKDKTDGELSLDFAKSEGFDRVVIYGAEGGRIDHILGNIALLVYAKSIGITAQINTKDKRVLLTDRVRLDLPCGAGFSFVPLCDMVVTRLCGAEYPLNNASVSAYSSIGISNVALGGILHFESTADAIIIFDKEGNIC